MLDAEILLTIKLQDTLFADPRRIELLRQIKQIGSINQAAKLAGVSYKTAWDNIDAMTKISPKPLLEQGGGTQLTSYAERLLQLYDLLQHTQKRAFDILHEENIPLDNALVATAKSSLKTSARNQLFGKVSGLKQKGALVWVDVNIEGMNEPICAVITEKSSKRLELTLGREVMLLIKAPWIKLNAQPTGLNDFMGKIVTVEQNEVIIEMQQTTFCATTESDFSAQVGEQIPLHIEPEQIILAAI